MKKICYPLLPLLTVTEEIGKIPIDDGNMPDQEGLTPERLIQWVKDIQSHAKKNHYSDIEVYFEYGSGHSEDGDGHYLKARGTRPAFKHEIQNRKEREATFLVSKYDKLADEMKFFRSAEGKKALVKAQKLLKKNEPRQSVSHGPEWPL